MTDRSGKETSDDLIPHNMPELGRTKSCVSCVTAPDCLSGAMFGGSLGEGDVFALCDGTCLGRAYFRYGIKRSLARQHGKAGFK